ncbi:hypothetical protein DGMP_33000 [Desulfomarina profundi]|uniref:PilZ domain-containing protein n=1 Tax=Desulfomarina profundi TaxID=2772557 RepID=A0A8D5FJ66_9BACT|nr:PilZ domain-containing protein [Desulfomarina profundi]BCL62607.1 hypothetical protein DGMP_33000 [Desulfomarina profundi]
MAEKKTAWDDIPSLDGLQVDWEYKPENPLGKRAHKRMKDLELYPILDVKSIPVKVVAGNFDEKGKLVDLTPFGLAIRLDSELAEDRPAKVGFFLGRQKILSRTKVKYSRKCGEQYITGMSFEGLEEEYQDFIKGIFASKISGLD